MKNIDNDNNGFIEIDEFIRATINKEKLLTEKNLKMAFDFFDKDKNGTISWEEISNVVFKNKKMPKIFMSQFLEEISSESGKDVNITFEDFCKIIKK